MKYCECGCGTVIKDNMRYVNYHYKKSIKKELLPPQLCECGCGQMTSPGCRLVRWHRSKKMKEAVSLKNKNHVVSDETKSKISKSLKDTWDDSNSSYHTDEYKKNRKEF